MTDEQYYKNATDMLRRAVGSADLVKQLAVANETIGNLQHEISQLRVGIAQRDQTLDLAQALNERLAKRIAELEVSFDQVNGFFAGAVAATRERDARIAELEQSLLDASVTDIKNLAIAMHKERARVLARFLVDVEELLDSDESPENIVSTLTDWVGDLFAIEWVKALRDADKPSPLILKEIDERIAELEAMCKVVSDAGYEWDGTGWRAVGEHKSWDMRAKVQP